VPPTEALEQGAPLAALLCDIKYRAEHLKVEQMDLSRAEEASSARWDNHLRLICGRQPVKYNKIKYLNINHHTQIWD
jgi:hypothetical protein